MNHLAHFYLAGADEGLIVGNFIADHVKGKKILDYPENISAGIEMHRAIDFYTDSHKLVKKANKLTRNELGRYNSIAMDVFFDHFLALNWEKYHADSLSTYSKTIYDLLDQYESQLPYISKRFLYYMKLHNLLVNYQNFETLEMVFSGISSRTQFDSNLAISTDVLQTHYEELKEIFFEFFLDLKSEFKPWLKN